MTTAKYPALSGHLTPHPGAPLYDPSFEHDACGIALVADLHGRRSQGLVRQALTALEHLAHRGATGAEVATGDGAGILVQVPHRFLTGAMGCDVPDAGGYATGLVFLPVDEDDAAKARRRIEELALEEGLAVLGWRDVPVELGCLGASALRAMPRMAQVVVAPTGAGTPPGGAPTGDALALDRLAFCLRKRVEHEVHGVYVPSLSARTLVYKGMLTGLQLGQFFPDLSDPSFDSGLALVHSRFSTNTFPSWPLAHPYRYLAHNGEINTLRGNRNWMRAREALLKSDLIPGDLERLFPICDPDGSDSATFDEVLELLHLGGRSLPHAVLMMIPEAWENHTAMDPARRAFYRYHASLMEPWDGPAGVVFTDGTVAGGVLDRNGLRPARVLGDRRRPGGAGVGGGRARHRPGPGGAQGPAPAGTHVPGRHRPGSDRRRRRDQGQLAAVHPYGQWLEEGQVTLGDLPPRMMLTPQHASVVTHQELFGYTNEELRLILAPMANGGAEAVGSMGHDAAIAALSERPRLIFDYFTQLFAQVTNPPLDAIREELVTSSRSKLGPEGNLLEPTAASCRQIILPYPGHRQRRAGQAGLRQRARGDAGLPGLRHRRVVRPHRRRRRAAGRPSRTSGSG